MTTEHTEGESTTREEVLRLVVERGPVRAAELAEALDLTSAAIRRHLSALEGAEQIRVQPEVAHGPRGRGRPAKRYIATSAAHVNLVDSYSRLAVQAIEQLRGTNGEDAVTEFAERRASDLVERYRDRVAAAGPDPESRTAALADLLREDGYAATSRPVGANLAIQLCQGHCPVQEIANAFPQLCEAETRAFSELLGVHVQRLATLAGGEHVCTTHVPVTIPPLGEGERTPS